MPTARPIIIEKFIDHTDIGVTHESMWSRAKPTAMPATASRSGMPAASRAPKAMTSMMTVGMPLTSSALWRASSFISLKSLHIGHSPVTSTWAPAGHVEGADERRRAHRPPPGGRRPRRSACSTGISAVVPSWEIIPASGGMAVGSTTETTFGPPWSWATTAVTPLGSSRDRRVLVVDDDRVLRPEGRELRAQLGPHLLGGRAVGVPARTRQGPGEGQGERGRGDGDGEPHEDHRLAMAGHRRGETGEQRPLVGIVRRLVSGEDGLCH